MHGERIAWLSASDKYRAVDRIAPWHRLLVSPIRRTSQLT
jgi:hypothetical protein